MRIRCAALVAFVLTWFAPGPVRAADSPEYEVKAAFLFNFAKFVEWPASHFAAPNAPLLICVLGRDPFGPTLDRIVREESVDDRPLSVVRPENVAAARPCHILFVSSSEQARFAEILAGLDRAHTLTVGEAPKFLEAGGHLRFFLAGNHVRFEIDQSKTERAEFRISSKLMRVARVVGRPGQGS